MTEQDVGHREVKDRGRLGIPPSEASTEAPTRLLRLAMRALPALAQLHRIRDEVRRLDDPFEVADYALRALRVEARLSAQSVDHIPGQGAVVITANHPFGGLDGLLEIAAIGRRRRDLRILANSELALRPRAGRQGCPVLLRQYLRLGGRVLGFNIDPEFANALDCLILIDLCKSEPRVLREPVGVDAIPAAAPRARSARRERNAGRPRLSSLRPARAGSDSDARRRESCARQR